MIKLIVSDLDGTLLDKAHQLDEETALAIKKVQEAGFLFMVATGRSLKNVVDLFAPYHIECPKILMNGAHFEDEEGKVIKEIVLHQNDLNNIFDILEECDIEAHIYSDQGVGCRNPEALEKTLRNHLKIRNQLSDKEVDDIMNNSNFCDFDFQILDKDLYINQKPNVFRFEGFAKDEVNLKKAFHKLGDIPTLAVSGSTPDNIEITHIDAQKGHMLEYVCKLMQIKKDEVITIGDSMNDITMLAQFPKSFAMANASQIVKEAAAFVAKSNEEHGVAEILYRVMDKEIL